MKHKKLFVISLSVTALLALLAVAWAQGPTPTPTYKLLAAIGVPGGIIQFDITQVDPQARRFYLADAGTKKGAGRVDVVDTQTNTFLYGIPAIGSTNAIGFAGFTGMRQKNGPNGIALIPDLNQIYAGDGDNSVKVVDLAARAVVAIIPLGGKNRADELAYDPVDHIVMMGTPGDDPPFLTFISTITQTVLGYYRYPPSQGLANGGGLEQPLWNPLDDKFYISVPATNTSSGSIDVFDPVKMTLVRSIPQNICSPAGLTLTPFQHLMTSCGVIVDARSGNTIAAITGVAGDQINYNPGDNRYYFGNANLAVVDAETKQLIIANNARTPFLPSPGGHTLGVDPINNHIFAPVTPTAGQDCPDPTLGCIKVFGVK